MRSCQHHPTHLWILTGATAARLPPTYLPVLRLRLPRALSRSAPPPASNLALTEVAMKDVLRSLTSAWRGVAGVQQRGGTSCPAQAELPAEPEDLLSRGVEWIPAVEW